MEASGAQKKTTSKWWQIELLESSSDNNSDESDEALGPATQLPREQFRDFIVP